MKSRVETAGASTRLGDLVSLPTGATADQIRALPLASDRAAARTMIELQHGELQRETDALLGRAAQAYREHPDETSFGNLRAAQFDVAELAARTHDLERSIDDVGLAFRDFSQGARDAIQSRIGEALYNLATGAGSVEDAFKSMGQGILRSLTDVEGRLITQALIGDFGVPQANGSYGGGGLFGSARSGFFGGLLGGARAAGVDVVAGRSYLVGEHGAEIFTPRRDGAIIPNDRIASVTRDAMVIEPKIYIVRDEDEAFAQGMRRHQDTLVGLVTRKISRGQIGKAIRRGAA